MKRSKLVQNLAFSVAYQILIIFLPLVTAPYIARVLGVNNAGVYSFSYSIAHYFVLFAMMGLLNYGTRSIAMVSTDKAARSKRFWEIYAIQFVSSSVAIFAYFVYLFIFSPDHFLIFQIQTVYVASALFDVSWYYQGMSSFKVIVIRNFVIKLLTIFCVFLFVQSRTDLWKYTAIMCGGILISQIILWIPLRKEIYFVRPLFKECIQHIKPNLLLFSSAIAVSIYKIMDKIMIGILAGYNDVGYYENAEKITNLPMGIIAAIGMVMLSKMASDKSDRKDEINTIRNTLKLLMPFSICISFGLFSVADRFAVFFFGVEFAYTGILLKYLGVITIFLTWGNVIRTQFLLPHKEDKLITISVFVGAIINFCINFILLPHVGAMGAVIGTILTELVVALIVTFYVSGHLPVKNFVKDMIPGIIIGMLMYLSIAGIGKVIGFKDPYLLFAQIIIGGIVYFGCLFLYWYLVRDPIIKIFRFKN